MLGPKVKKIAQRPPGAVGGGGGRLEAAASLLIGTWLRGYLVAANCTRNAREPPPDCAGHRRPAGGRRDVRHVTEMARAPLVSFTCPVNWFTLRGLLMSWGLVPTGLRWGCCGGGGGWGWPAPELLELSELSDEEADEVCAGGGSTAASCWWWGVSGDCRLVQGEARLVDGLGSTIDEPIESPPGDESPPPRSDSRFGDSSPRLPPPVPPPPVSMSSSVSLASLPSESAPPAPPLRPLRSM